jgi:tRNA/rRNA methyltransferase
MSKFSLTFILVEPAVPENVGAAARAMKTMGISNLRLVKPCEHLSVKARMLAHASNDVLENAEVSQTLAEAVQGIDFVIGTTARKRTKRADYHPVEHLPSIITAKGNTIRSAAIVFGREETGLTNEEVALCHTLSSISMVATYPSLNLGQAVMLYAYILSPLVGKKVPTRQIRKNEPGWNALRAKIEFVLPQIGILPSDLIFTRIMERISLLGDMDVNLLHTLVAGIENKELKITGEANNKERK